MALEFNIYLFNILKLMVFKVLAACLEPAPNQMKLDLEVEIAEEA